MTTPTLPTLPQANLPPDQYLQTPTRPRRSKRIVSSGHAGPQSSPVAAIPAGLTPPARKRAVSTGRAPTPIARANPSPKSNSPQIVSDLPVARQRPGPNVLSTPQNVVSMPELQRSESPRQSDTPQPPPRAQSEPIPSGSRFFKADRSIQIRIEKGPNAKEFAKPRKALGYTYMFKVQLPSGGPSLFKIGVTENDPKLRASSIKSKCLFANIDESPKAIAQSKPFYWMAEKLVHDELEPYRYEILCKCKTQHLEYFHVPESVALDSLNRWRSFCENKPWDESGKLKALWVERLRNRCKYDDKTPGDYWTQSRRLASRWKAFTEPCWAESLCNDLVETAGRIFRWRLHVPALGEAFALALRIPLNSWAPHWVGLVILLVFAEFSQIENTYTANHLARMCRGGWQKIYILLDGIDEIFQPTKDCEFIEPSPSATEAPQVIEEGGDPNVEEEATVPQPDGDGDVEMGAGDDEVVIDTIHVQQTPPQTPDRTETVERLSLSDSF